MYILTNSKPVKTTKINRFYNKLFLDAANNKIYSSDQYIIKNFDIELTEEEKTLIGENIYSFDCELLNNVRKNQFIAIIEEDNLLYFAFDNNRSVYKYPLVKENIGISHPYKLINDNNLIISIPKSVLKELASKEENGSDDVLLCFNPNRLTRESLHKYATYNNGTKGLFVYTVKNLKVDDYFDFPYKVKEETINE